MALPIRSREATWLQFINHFLPPIYELLDLGFCVTKFRNNCLCGMILDQNILGPSQNKDHDIASLLPLICKWRQTYYGFSRLLVVRS